MMALLQGIGIEAILEAVVERIPPPADNIADHETRALIFDSAYDPYRVSLSPALFSTSAHQDPVKCSLPSAKVVDIA